MDISEIDGRNEKTALGAMRLERVAKEEYYKMLRIWGVRDRTTKKFTYARIHNPVEMSPSEGSKLSIEHYERLLHILARHHFAISITVRGEDKEYTHSTESIRENKIGGLADLAFENPLKKYFLHVQYRFSKEDGDTLRISFARYENKLVGFRVHVPRNMESFVNYEGNGIRGQSIKGLWLPE
tara:strand:- start:76 stop:624 length:549 start_codon:yes stop_codon:yes gene_type:complete